MYFRNNPNHGEIVVLETESDNLTFSEYNASLPSKIIIHGFASSKDEHSLQSIKNEYLIKGDYNVWMMDWRELVRGPTYCYPAAMNNLAHAAYCLGLAVGKIKETADVPDPDIHVIGFSLGAHVVSGAAKQIMPYRITRVTGLDPAMPGFVLIGRKDRLSKDSGEFVDVIHTDGLFQGLIEQLGHVDIYMNGGIHQPGCEKNNISTRIFCGHYRAPEYFAESINSMNGFYGYGCKNLFYLVKLCKRQGLSPVLLGDPISNRISGSYVAETNPSSPYAQGKW